MKKIIKKTVGRCLIAVAHYLPGTRQFLKPLGVRTSQGLFGARVVSIPIGRQRWFRLAHVDDSYLSFQLFWHGTDYYEPITRALLLELLRPGDLFLDIGAHLGFFTLTAASAVQGLRIIAFEPNPKNFRNLASNVASNKLTEVLCEPLAISDNDGVGTLYLTDSDMSASLMKDFQAQDTKQIDRIEVRTASVDTYLREHQVRNPRVIKVDIEGNEPAFFRGATETIATYKPDIILEVLDEQEPRLVAELRSLGYRFYPITDEGLVELETPRLVKRYPFLFLNHLVSARPREELVTLFERVAAQTRNINLLHTSKHFPKEAWPCLWTEPQHQHT